MDGGIAMEYEEHGVRITLEDGKAIIEAEEIILNGDVWINGSPT